MVLTNLELKIIVKYGKIQTSDIKMPEYLPNIVHFDVPKKQSICGVPNLHAHFILLKIKFLLKCKTF